MPETEQFKITGWFPAGALLTVEEFCGVLSDVNRTEIRWRDTSGDHHSALMEDDMGDTRDHGSESPPAKFENVYPHYEFSELVRIAVLTAERLHRFFRDRRIRRTSAVGA